jgi:alanine dehydrogenase
MLILNRREVTGLLSMPTCIELMTDALGSLAHGDVILPLRPVIRIPDTPNAFAVMPVWSRALDASGAKLISVYPGNHGTALDSHQGMVALFDGSTGEPLAIMDAASITAIRTAAVSGVATRMLARPASKTILIVGAGVQARSHIDAMLAVGRFERVIIWSRATEHARSLADSVRTAGVRTEATDDLTAAVPSADVICTVTASREPVLRGEWLRPGTHINAVGASVPAARELDTECIRRARVFVDRRESALNEAGDLLIPIREGAITAEQIGPEIGQVLEGTARGRTTDEEITLFKSLGLAVEDLACAVWLHERATRDGIGTRVEL